jgi:hypothetical protein
MPAQRVVFDLEPSHIGHTDLIRLGEMFRQLPYHFPLLREIILLRHEWRAPCRQKIIDMALEFRAEDHVVSEVFKESETNAQKEHVIIQDFKTEEECTRFLLDTCKFPIQLANRWWFKNPKLTVVEID